MFMATVGLMNEFFIIEKPQVFLPVIMYSVVNTKQFTVLSTEHIYDMLLSPQV